MIIDTDVLIWYMKGNEKAYKAIEKVNNFSISVVTYMELVQAYSLPILTGNDKYYKIVKDIQIAKFRP